MRTHSADDPQLLAYQTKLIDLYAKTGELEKRKQLIQELTAKWTSPAAGTKNFMSKAVGEVLEAERTGRRPDVNVADATREHYLRSRKALGIYHPSTCASEST